jgi:hypothetical protein
MSGETMSEKLYFESIKEYRGSYFVEYCPPIAGSFSAALNLVFPEEFDVTRVAGLMESELRHWISRYPVPLCVSAWDAKENLIRVGDDDCELVGWIVPATGAITLSGKLDDLTTFIKASRRGPDWRTIYTDIPFKTDAEVKANAEKNLQERRHQNLVLKIILTFWLAAIPAAFAVLKYFGPAWLGMIVLIYSLWKALQAGRKLLGYAKPSRSEKEKAEKELKMAHYYHHCERNPDGFSRLMVENLEKEIQAGNQKEAAQLADVAADQHRVGSVERSETHREIRRGCPGQARA